MYKQLIIDTCKNYGLLVDQAAYVLATIHWETNSTFEPVREAYYLGSKAETFRKKLKYYPYYGRGFIQLTWKTNYAKAGKYFKLDLVKEPDLVMEAGLSAKIAVIGMKEGWFTDKALKDYIDGKDESDKEDFLEYYNARRIVNGMDKANNIAVLAEQYEKELKANGYSLEDTEKPAEGDETSSGSYPSQKPWMRLLALLIELLKRVFIK